MREEGAGAPSGTDFQRHRSGGRSPDRAAGNRAGRASEQGVRGFVRTDCRDLRAGVRPGDGTLDHCAFLAELSIGDSVAENEFQTLGEYYLRTDQYKRAAREEVNMVVGRKGTGKTALFSQLRNEKRANVRNIVVDLEPEGYQLIRLKEDVLDYLAEGARTHLITALFEYLFYLEICYKLLEKDRERHIRDGRLYEPYRKLLEVCETGSAGEGDF